MFSKYLTNESQLLSLSQIVLLYMYFRSLMYFFETKRNEMKHYQILKCSWMSAREHDNCKVQLQSNSLYLNNNDCSYDFNQSSVPILGETYFPWSFFLLSPSFYIIYTVPWMLGNNKPLFIIHIYMDPVSIHICCKMTEWGQSSLRLRFLIPSSYIHNCCCNHHVRISRTSSHGDFIP